MGFNKIKKKSNCFTEFYNYVFKNHRVITLLVFFVLTHNYDPKSLVNSTIRIFLLVLSSICVLGTDQSILYFTGILKAAMKRKN
jgi:hypothetical protein